MPIFEKWKAEQELDYFRKIAHTQFLWVHRPLLVHERSTTGNVCPCCNSRQAEIVETIQHIDLLINPLTGQRKLRSEAKSTAAFDDLCHTAATKLDLPRRVSRKQLAALRCMAKILAIFGGVRGGKTSFLADSIFDALLFHGSPGVQVWWCSPTLEMLELAFKKMLRGETVVDPSGHKRHVEPLIPPELIRYIPSSAKSDRRLVELIEGTEMPMHHMAKDGSNLKGRPPVLIGMDEGCAVADEENYKQALDRLLESDGRLLIATTPVAGHWLKKNVYDVGQPVEEWDGKCKHAWTHLTAFDNPWVDTSGIQSTIESIGDPQRVRREVYGEWVGNGPLLWRHLDESIHIVKHKGYKPAEWGLVNITEKVLKRFFRVPVQDYSGMDFDINPMSFAAVQVCTHPDLDESNPKNWIFVQYDEVIDTESGTIHRFADNLQERGFASWAIACDPSGAQPNSYRVSHGVDPSSTHAEELEQRGFRVEPCHRSDRGRPKAPPVLDTCNVMHRLMYESIQLPDGSYLPRFQIHERCRRTIDCLRIQEADEHGMPVKEPGTESDRISGPTDAMRYAAWVPFQDIYAVKAKWAS